MATTNEQDLSNIPKRLPSGRPSITTARLNDILARHMDGWSYRQNAKVSRCSVSSIVRAVRRAREEGALLP
jgi:Mor family transcriptional regulator